MIEVEEATFAGDENEMTTESGYNNNHFQFISPSSVSSGDKTAFDSEEVSSYGHHHVHQEEQHPSMMYLHTNFGDTFFFKPFTTSSHLETFYVCTFLFILAIIYNSLKSYQYHLNQKRPSLETTCYPVAEKFSEASIESGHDNHHHIVKLWIKSVISIHNLLDSVMHIVIITIGYLLMLAVMSFNLWILIAVIAGEGIGYFIFGWARRTPSADSNQVDNESLILKTCSFSEQESK